MRSIGTHRGNPVLRSSVSQASRRRLWAELTPYAGDPDGELDPLRALRFSRGFFERVRDRVRSPMPPAMRVDGAELHYFGLPELGLWALQAAHGLVVAYEHMDTPGVLRERARRWLACLRTRTAPGMVTPHWGHPVYGARLDPANDQLDVVWAWPGDWCGFVLDEEPAPRLLDLPPYWRQRELASA
jgi:hypothetical protein